MSQQKKLDARERAELGGRIRLLREDLSLTQEQLAPMLGIHKMTLSRYETGSTQPDAALLLELCRINERMSPDWLLTGQGPMLRPFMDLESFATPGSSTGHGIEGALSPDQVIKLLAAAERERLAPDERKLLNKYQSLPPAQRARLWALLDAGAADPPEEPPTMVNEVEAERGKGKG